MILYPEAIFPSVDEVPFAREYSRGVRGIIFDIDNTLVPHGAPADGHVKALFRELREMGFQCCLISNNHEARVRPFAEAAGAFFQCDAGKPMKKGYLKAMERMETAPRETIFIGDQLFTDVWGANRAGIRSFLVNPIAPSSDPLQVRLKRILERPLLYFYKRRERRRKS